MALSSISVAPAGSLLGALGDRSDELAASRRILERHEHLAERLYAEGKWEDAVSAAAVGAACATACHPGVLGSLRLERVLTDVATTCLEPLRQRERPSSPRRVLHVATEMYGVGGHTRVLWRWIARDASRSHALVTTAQRSPVVDGVTAALAASGGALFALNPDAPWLERARALRELAADFDAVVLHIHHHDAVPILAFAGGTDRPPVILFDHADHMFWLGTSVIDVLYGGRPCPASELRGISNGRRVTGPFPVSGPDGHDLTGRSDDARRAELRSQLLGQFGWPLDTCLLVTVGHPFKYQGPGGTTLVDAVLPALRELPQARLLAVGPAGAEDFARVHQQTGGRAIAVGPVSGVAPLLAAADIYLESRPTGGPSASAEAALAGLPVLSYAATPLEAGLICTDPMYGAHVAQSPDQYSSMLRSLIEDDQLREQLAQSSNEAVLESDRGFGAAIDGAYRRAAELGPVSAEELSAPTEGHLPLHTIVDMVQGIAAPHNPGIQAEVAIASLELSARSSSIRSLFRSLCGGQRVPELAMRYTAAFAAPPAEPEILTALIEEFRRLALVGAAQRYVIALRPEDRDVAVPALEAALAAGPDIDVELILDDDPQRVRPADSLEVVCDEDEQGGEHSPKPDWLPLDAAWPAAA